jgi:hypothetical protein
VWRGLASQTVTPRGTPARPRPFVFRSPAPGRARLGRAAQPGAGVASAVLTPLGQPSRPRPFVFRSPPPRRARPGSSGLAGAGIAAPAFPVLVNTFEGGTNGVTVSPGNSGGASGAAFDSVTIGGGATLAFDSTRAAHGALSLQVATVASATSYVQWSASMGPQSPAWFRAYLYLTANPAANHRAVTFLQGGTLCGYVQVLTTGRLQFVNAAGSAIFTTTAAVPLGQWFRIEGFLTGDATAGQVELKLFASQADGVTPDETDTSSAAQNTAGRPDTVRYGVAAAVANAGPFWMDDLGLSATGYLGPSGAATLGTPGPLFRPQPRSPAPRRGLWRGLASRIVTPLGTPTARRPVFIAGGRRTRATIGHGQVAGGVAGPPAVAPPAPQAYQHPLPLPRRPAPRRAIWHGNAGPQPAAAPAVIRLPRQPRSAPPRRALWRGLGSRIVTPLGIPSRKPPPPANTPRKRQRALWRRGAGPQPPPPSGLLAGTTAGPPQGRWAAALPAPRWQPHPAAPRWQAALPAPRYDAGNPESRWQAGPPVKGRYSMRIITGSVEYIQFPVTGPAGVDVTTFPVELAVVPEAHGEPGPADPAWTAGSWLGGLASLLVDAAVPGPGDYVVYGRLTATPEKPVVRSGRVRIGPAA